MSFEAAMREIDAAHAEDPRQTENGPYELHYARRCTEYLTKLDPSADELLKLAVRAQHFRRWEVPRSGYPMTKAGYFKWRTGLKARQAEMTATILVGCGYRDADAQRVAKWIRKEGFKDDPAGQTLEDVACLVFLEDGFELFRHQHEQAKIVHVLRKTWPKMSERGHEVAVQIDLSPEAAEVVKIALS
ncbi:Putative uncharacterized protein [Taphrina deformans PYCC 5710]|uniref:Glutamyl-tRNA synthetase n=1 Tax=Taphrina deformans (strain PYCC 5710 / ATCC 11124 / CBS 356.35 / IMI 108563 / JCM 9778 / NBRC 8474) TaxID=1097556 RepID=R4X9Q2_TAPDE|nr:Putative uncharacterized protein [Taphrina deformans PYCC 5710]|eukprot:CCG82460.1 Putative uncharacterized protein [Taphrina deformans PYCC 5710]